MAFGRLASTQIKGFSIITPVYTATGPAVIDLIVANTIGLPINLNVAISLTNPPLASDYIIVNKTLAPNIAAIGSTIFLRKLLLNNGDTIQVTMLPPEDYQDYKSSPIWILNAQVQGVDGLDFTSAHYTY